MGAVKYPKLGYTGSLLTSYLLAKFPEPSGIVQGSP